MNWPRQIVGHAGTPVPGVSVAAMARDHLDSVLWSLEQPEFDEVFPCAKVFVEHAKSVAKLANDFESERQAIVRQAAVR